jgi:chromate transport protein ChrA
MYLAATLTVSLPCMILMTIVAVFFLHFYEHPKAQALFTGLRPRRHPAVLIT